MKFLIVLGALALLALSSVPASADPLVIRAAHGSLHKLCDLPLSAAPGARAARFWSGCYNRHTGQIYMASGYQSADFNRIYSQLVASRTAGTNFVVWQKKFTVIFDGPKGNRDYCDAQRQLAGAGSQLPLCK